MAKSQLDPVVPKFDLFFPTQYGEVRLTLSPDGATFNQNGADIDMPVEVFLSMISLPLDSLAGFMTKAA